MTKTEFYFSELSENIFANFRKKTWKFGKFSENIVRKFGKHIFRTFGKVDDIPLRLKSKFKTNFHDSKSKFSNVLLYTFPLELEMGLKFTP